MKSILKFVVCAFLFEFVIFVSCKKDGIPKDNHLPPIANAGPDRNVTLASCSASTLIPVDGSRSSDPDNNISSYLWTIVSAPSLANLYNSTSPIAKFDFLSPGNYVLELKVTDEGGLTSKDTVQINITGQVVEYDLDVSTTTAFSFIDNYEDCYIVCSWYDYISFQGTFDFPPIGQLDFSAEEYADTAVSGSSRGVTIRLFAGGGNNHGAWGTCPIRFKELIEKGGGSFSGTLSVGGGSAQPCNQNIYDNLGPLTVTGNLNATARTVNINIKGKVYF